MAQLLRGGKVLVHTDKDDIDAIRADILVRDGRIEKVEANITIDGPHEVLDCTDKLISPGFVDTHHHVWQTQLKGLHANHSLLEYLPGGNQGSTFYRPDDVFYGQLSGLLEAMNGGITTLLDFSHINYSPENVFAAIQATEVSGIRSVYGYCPTPRVRVNADGTFEGLPFLEPWIMDTFGKLAHEGPWSRTSLGFAFDGLFLPKEMVKPVLDQVYAANIKVLTHHDNSYAMFNDKPSSYQLLSENGLLDPSNNAHWVMVHSTKLHKHPIAELKKNNFFTSISPVSELSMGMGQPVPYALNREHDEIASQVSIGIDCHTIGENFIPGQLRAQLLAVRQYAHAKEDAQGRWYASMDPKHGHFAGVKDAFNLGTINGARALGMQDSIGRIKVGYKADLVFFDAKSPAMLAVAEEDPVAAIVIHSQPGDVTGVMVDGHVRKWDGRLLPTQVESGKGLLAGYKVPVEGDLSWKALADAVLESRERIMPLVKKIDMAKSAEAVVNMFGLKRDGLLDPVTN